MPNRTVTDDEIEELAAKYQVLHYITSAKTGENVQDAFSFLAVQASPFADNEEEEEDGEKAPQPKEEPQQTPTEEPVQQPIEETSEQPIEQPKEEEKKDE